jgi:hypothetical protein
VVIVSASWQPHVCLNKPGELQSAPKKIPWMEFADLVGISANTRAVSGEICTQENSASGGVNRVDYDRHNRAEGER